MTDRMQSLLLTVIALDALTEFGDKDAVVKMVSSKGHNIDDYVKSLDNATESVTNDVAQDILLKFIESTLSDVMDNNDGQGE